MRAYPARCICVFVLLAAMVGVPGAQAQAGGGEKSDAADREEILARMERLEAKIDLLIRAMEGRSPAARATMQPAVYRGMQGQGQGQGQGNSMNPTVPPGMSSGLQVDVQFCASRGMSFSINTELLAKLEAGGNGNIGNGIKGLGGVNPATAIGPNGYAEMNLAGEWDIVKLGLGGEWTPRELTVCLTLPPRPLAEDIDTMEVKDKFERRIDRMTKRLLRRVLGKEPDEAFSQAAIAQVDPPTPLDDMLLVDDLVDNLDFRASPQGLVDKLRDPQMLFDGIHDTVTQLPLPAKLAETAGNPSGALQGFLPQSIDDLSICNLSLGAGLFAQICTRAQDIDRSILTLGDSLSTIEEQVATFCNGVNSRFGTMRGTSFGSFVHFPVLDSTVLTNLGSNPFRPLSGLSNVTCPDF